MMAPIIVGLIILFFASLTVWSFRQTKGEKLKIYRGKK